MYFDYINSYKYSIDFKQPYGEYYYNLLKDEYPQEVIEREKINEIILDSKGRIGNKLEKIIIIQMFSDCSTIFHLSYDELLSFLIKNNNDLPPTVSENERLEKLLSLITKIKKDLITREGIYEFYPEWKYLDKYIVGNILKIADYAHLSQMIKSSDVKLALSSYKKISYTKFKNSIIKRKITYREFKKERRDFEAMYGDRYIDKLNELETSYKFKLDGYSIALIKKLRKNTIYDIDMSNTDYLLDLQQHISPVYWNRISKSLWKGIKEFRSIIRLREVNFDRYVVRKKIYIERYIYFYDRLSNLFDKHGQKSVLIDII